MLKKTQKYVLTRKRTDNSVSNFISAKHCYFCFCCGDARRATAVTFPRGSRGGVGKDVGCEEMLLGDESCVSEECSAGAAGAQWGCGSNEQRLRGEGRGGEGAEVWGSSIWWQSESDDRDRKKIPAKARRRLPREHGRMYKNDKRNRERKGEKKPARLKISTYSFTHLISYRLR